MTAELPGGITPASWQGNLTLHLVHLRPSGWCAVHDLKSSIDIEHFLETLEQRGGGLSHHHKGCDGDCNECRPPISLPISVCVACLTDPNKFVRLDCVLAECLHRCTLPPTIFMAVYTNPKVTNESNGDDRMELFRIYQYELRAPCFYLAHCSPTTPFSSRAVDELRGALQDPSCHPLNVWPDSHPYSSYDPHPCGLSPSQPQQQVDMYQVYSIEELQVILRLIGFDQAAVEPSFFKLAVACLVGPLLARKHLHVDDLQPDRLFATSVFSVPRGSQTVFVCPPLCLGHASEPDAENAERVRHCCIQLQNHGVAPGHPLCRSEQGGDDDQLLATDQQLLRVHTPEHVTCLTASKMSGRWNGITSDQVPISINVNSNDAARATTGGLIRLVDQVMTNVAWNGFVVGRPPGHHSSSGAAAGFCLINNVAVAVEHALATRPWYKIVVFDFDIHAADGSQQIFYDRPEVLVFSIHKWMRGDFYPYDKTTYVGPKAVGEGAGAGFNINVALNSCPLGDKHYVKIVETLLLPILHQFRPDLIFLSAGFDICAGDPIGAGPDENTPGMLVTSAGIAQMVRLIRDTNPYVPILGSLEGGYIKENVANGVEALMWTLMGQDHRVSAASAYTKQQKRAMKRASPCFELDLLDVLINLVPYWPCLRSSLDTQRANVARVLEKQQKGVMDAEVAANTAHMVALEAKLAMFKFQERARTLATQLDQRNAAIRQNPVNDDTDMVAAATSSTVP